MVGISPLPSEQLEPMLAGVVDWYFRDLVASAHATGDPAAAVERALTRLLGAIGVLNRLVILNRSENPRQSDGVHASLAMLAERRRFEEFADLPPAHRVALLKALPEAH